jgi:stage II sporulation protein E
LVGLALVYFAFARLTRSDKRIGGPGLAGLVAASVLVPKGVVLALRQAPLEDVLALGSEAVLAALLSLAFATVLGSRARREIGAPVGEEVACWLVFLIGLLVSLNGIELAGISLVKVGAGLLVLLASLTGGAGGGAVAGVAVGLVPFLVAFEPPSWIALYSVSGLLGGLLASFRRAGVVMGFLLGVLVMSVYYFSRSAVVDSLEAALVAAAIFFLLPEPVVDQLGWLPLAVERTEEYWERRLRRAQEIIRGQLRQLAAVFRDLGESFRQVNRRSERDVVVLPQWSELAAKVCSSCPVQELCLRKEGQTTANALVALYAVLQDKGQVDSEDLPPEIRGKCIRPRELVAGLNRTWDMYRRYRFWQEQLDQTRELVSEQLRQVAGIIAELEKKLVFQGEKNWALSLAVTQALHRERVTVQEAEVIVRRDGRAEVYVEMPKCETRAVCQSRLRELVSRIVGQPLQAEDRRCPWEIGGTTCQVRFLPVGMLRLGTGLAQAAKDGCAFCGDSWAAMPLPGGYYFLGLSDGMGSGRKAAQESQAAIAMVSRLLSLGFTPEIAVATVNSLLLPPGGQDRFATMDLAFINLFTGEGKLVKVGAAPSFVKRGDQVWVLDGGSPPAGILREVKVSVTTRWFEAGDILVLVTDGMLVRGEEWLLQALREIKHTEPQAIADLVLHQALALAGNCLRDDISVLVARVEKAG